MRYSRRFKNHEKWQVTPSPIMDRIFKDIDKIPMDKQKLNKLNEDYEHNYLAMKQVVLVLN